jgi:hypothetical protein
LTLLLAPSTSYPEVFCERDSVVFHHPDAAELAIAGARCESRKSGGPLSQHLASAGFGDVSLEQARERACKLTSAARRGVDLLAEEAEAREAKAREITVEKLIERYVDRKVRGRLKTSKEIERRQKVRALSGQRHRIRRPREEEDQRERDREPGLATDGGLTRRAFPFAP